MRIRLRPAHCPAELAALYPVPHGHARWPDHVERVARTISFARGFYPAGSDGCRGVIADLSCGDAAIARALGPAARVLLGDIAAGYEICGPIEQTVALVSHADLWLLCETAEHLDDPDAVLRGIRERSDRLVLSTPIGENSPVNPEHYWGWDAEGVRDMLTGAGWKSEAREDVAHPLGAYQLWGCL